MPSERDIPHLWELLCRAAGLPVSSSVDAVHKHFGGAVGRGTIQRLREGGEPRMSSMNSLAEHLGYASFTALANANPLARGLGSSIDELPRVDHPPLLSWGTILTVEEQGMPHRFRCEVPDDALWSASDGGSIKGTPVVFVRTQLHPAPGTGVIVETSAGKRHMRIFRQGPGDSWIAAARNANYSTFDSETHGLKLLAVAENRLLDGQL